MDELNRQNPYMRLIFLFGFFALSIGDAFNVLCIKEIAERFAPPSRLQLFITMPVTAMSAMMILGVISANSMIKRSGGMISFLKWSTFITGAGMLLRGLAFHYLILFAGFMAVGFGYGCFYMGIRYYAYLFDNEKDRIEALAYISGGSFAGQCMGTVLGGIMAGQMSYRTVYLLAVLLLIMPLILIRHLDIDRELSVGGIRDALKVLTNPHSVIYLIFMVLPLFACTIFISYTVPLAADEFGFSSTVISALLLGSYLIAAYAGPVITKAITGATSALNATFLYCIGIAFLIAVFSLGRTFPLLVLVVLMIGLMDSFGPSVMTEAYTSTVQTDKHSAAETLMVYILVTRVGMTIAPSIILLFGSEIALSGMVIIGLALFLIFGTVINIMTGRGTNEKSN
jgi:predicted MFS family arabinose efflux permease